MQCTLCGYEVNDRSLPPPPLLPAASVYTCTLVVLSAALLRLNTVVCGGRLGHPLPADNDTGGAHGRARALILVIVIARFLKSRPPRDPKTVRRTRGRTPRRLGPLSALPSGCEPCSLALCRCRPAHLIKAEDASRKLFTRVQILPHHVLWLLNRGCKSFSVLTLSLSPDQSTLLVQLESATRSRGLRGSQSERVMWLSRSTGMLVSQLLLRLSTIASFGRRFGRHIVGHASLVLPYVPWQGGSNIG